MKPNKKLSRPSARKGVAKKTGKGENLGAAGKAATLAPPVVCVTGSTPEALSRVFDVLVQAGVSPAVVSEGRKSVDIHDWHEQVLEQLPDDWYDSDDGSAGLNDAGGSGGLSNFAKLGRFWDQMASEIFVANFDAQAGRSKSVKTERLSQPWGWADAGSVELLSYWASFHPQIRFLLTVSTPHKILVDTLDDVRGDTKAEASANLGDDVEALAASELPDLLDALRSWQWRTERALRFYHRRAQRAELIWVDQAVTSPKALIDRLQQQWGCTLDAATVSATAVSGVIASDATASDATVSNIRASLEPSGAAEAVDFLPGLSSLVEAAGIKTERNQIVAQVLSMLPEVMSLYHELLATVPILVDENADSEVGVDEVSDAVGSVFGIVSSSVEQTQELPILSLEDDISLPDSVLARIEGYQAKLVQFHRVKKESAAAVQKLRAQLAAQTQSAKAEVEKAVARVKEAEEENDLLLAQLHQVQEELEKYFLKAQESETKAVGLQKQTETDKDELTKLVKQKKDADAKIDELQKVRQTLEASSKKLTADLEQSRKSHEATAKQFKDAEAKLQQAEKKHKEAVAKLELDVKEAKAAKDLQARLKDTEEENDLLLAQLHQVQEELERYFLKAQELEQSSEVEQSRWHNLIQRLANRYSSLYDYQSIELIESESNPQAHVWQIDDYIDASGREMEALKFEVLSRDGFVGFGFTRIDQPEVAATGVDVSERVDSVNSAPNTQSNQESESKKNSSGYNNQDNNVYNNRNGSALLFWPVLAEAVPAGSGKDSSSSKSERFELVPGKTEAAIARFAANLDALSASDWAFLKTLTDLMIEQYQQIVAESEDSLEVQEPEDESAQENWGSSWVNNLGTTSSANSANAPINAQGEEIDHEICDQIDMEDGLDGDEVFESSSQLQNPDLWLKGLQQFATLLERLPPVLRFDSVSVTSSAEEGDYAHLVLSLSNVVTERGSFPEFQFRVATVSSGAVFDANPRLEFPRRTGEDVFERWFVESSNAFGENLEIRFAKHESIVDMPLVTAKLKDADRHLVAQLIERLPSVMLRIKHHAQQAKGRNPTEVDDAYSSRAQFSGQAKKRLNAPVTLAPAVGRLSDKDLDNWLQVTTTMRSIWRAQVRF